MTIHHSLKRLLERFEIEIASQGVPLLVQVHACLWRIEDMKEYALLKRRQRIEILILRCECFRQRCATHVD